MYLTNITPAYGTVAYIRNSNIVCFVLYIIKAYHKANDERKNYVMEVFTTKGAFDYVRSSQKIGSEISDISLTAATSRIGQVYVHLLLLLLIVVVCLQY